MSATAKTATPVLILTPADHAALAERMFASAPSRTVNADEVTPAYFTVPATATAYGMAPRAAVDAAKPDARPVLVTYNTAARKRNAPARAITAANRWSAVLYGAARTVAADDTNARARLESAGMLPVLAE